MQKNGEQAQYLLQSVDNALCVLNLFDNAYKLSLTEIAAQMGMGKTTALRLVYTLEMRGFLCRGEDNKYSLGMRLFTLGNRVYEQKAYLPVVKPLLDQLTETVNESAHLVTWENRSRVILLYEALPHLSLRAEMDRSISSRPPHLTSTGLALLSTLSDEQIAAYADSAIFEKRTAYSISTREQLEEDVRFVRSHGYAINNQRFEQGMISIAVPVQRTKGAPADFAISISGPSTRIADRQDTIVQELFKTAGRISELL